MSMKQSVLGEAANLTGRQGIPRSLKKPEVYYTGNDTPRLGTISHTAVLILFSLRIFSFPK